jgi:hypothetical protein
MDKLSIKTHKAVWQGKDCYRYSVRCQSNGTIGPQLDEGRLDDVYETETAALQAGYAFAASLDSQVYDGWKPVGANEYINNLGRG